MISSVTTEELQDKRIVLFSYGSGLAASMFSIQVKGSTKQMRDALNLEKRLVGRTVVTPERFDSVMMQREVAHGKKDYTPEGIVNADNYFPGTFYLESVDGNYRRKYALYE